MRWLLRPSRLLAIVLILLVGYSLIGFFLLPYVIKALFFRLSQSDSTVRCS